MFGINYKNWINENIKLKVIEYQKMLNVEPSWDDIEVGYANTEDEKFMEFYKEEKCNHPKKLYRPGNTIVCHFIPISKELIKKYQDGDMDEKTWFKLCLDTRQVSRGITDAVTSTLQGFGREVALLSQKENWSHICGAEVAGLGKFEYKDNMFCIGDKIGYLGAVSTELKLD
ncbi:hypothetical protein [Anaerovorax odorimutans]|uniref:hypothetical protein n=1 Tax=Anaerovorax odorimutans TaxID=109327 RepID=UPI0003F95ADE|nr:hypothetical protein [Anaerovorax odorimutans]